MFHGIVFKELPSEDICVELFAQANHLTANPTRPPVMTKKFLNVWMAQQAPLSSASFTEFHQLGRAIIMAWTRLDNFDALILEHQLNPTLTQAELILHLYFKFKEN